SRAPASRSTVRLLLVLGSVWKQLGRTIERRQIGVRANNGLWRGEARGRAIYVGLSPDLWVAGRCYQAVQCFRATRPSQWRARGGHTEIRHPLAQWPSPRHLWQWKA